ncbi:hypothetical protein JR316_0011509 [Psilocybe cubensis]|uniref:Uncharacterized protein n=2 Tax=Psilocybe cubensis TaxID=181762 RepID=A0ACB8GKM7_PSICU|nr:hypothetical protein JR316_0011509 [Psilocybe cubensis]KAH9475947.1 hypothetical protein JR316_0011509 [Psilocybe cubensis]
MSEDTAGGGRVDGGAASVFGALCGSANGMGVLTECCGEGPGGASTDFRGSFVVVAPQQIPSNRKAFTTAVIDALRSEKESISTLTAESKKAEESRRNDLISVTIFAGAAHGIENGTTFNVYANHVDTNQKPIGHLEVVDRYHPVINSTTTKLELPLDTKLPVVFFVVETGSLSRALNVYADKVAMSMVKGPRLNMVNESMAHIILRNANDKVEVLWNDFPKSGLDSGKNLVHNIAVLNNPADLEKALSNAAWFTHRVSYMRNPMSSCAFFEAELKAVDENQEPTGKNLLLDDAVTLDITQDNNRTTYCLLLSNKTDHEIWPYVFICNPSDFSIRPWYTATKALSPKMMGATNTVEIGCGDEDDLAFEWTADQGVDVAYINIIATKERTNFSCLTQSETTTVERLREVAPNQSISTQANEEPRKRRGMSIKKDWEMAQIPITRKYVQRTSRTVSPSASRKPFWNKFGK